MGRLLICLLLAVPSASLAAPMVPAPPLLLVLEPVPPAPMPEVPLPSGCCAD